MARTRGPRLVELICFALLFGAFLWKMRCLATAMTCESLVSTVVEGWCVVDGAASPAISRGQSVGERHEALNWALQEAAAPSAGTAFRCE